MAEPGFATDKDAGPEIFAHIKVVIEPSGSLEELPFKVTLSVGRVII